MLIGSVRSFKRTVLLSIINLDRSFTPTLPGLANREFRDAPLRGALFNSKTLL